MPRSHDFPFPRRYNSLRLLGFDYGNTSSLFFVTIDTDSSRPVFADFALAKLTLAALLNATTAARIRLVAYTLLPDHLHVLAGVNEKGKNLSSALGAFKSYTTQLYWKRGHQIAEEKIASLASSFQKSNRRDAAVLLSALSEWRASLRPEEMQLKNWPRARPEHFLSKQLWHGSFNDHIIRNDNDLRETIKYIALNSVKRGYVNKPQYYPFTGFATDEGMLAAHA